MKNSKSKFIFTALAIFCAVILFGDSASAQTPVPKGMVLQKQPGAASAKFRVTLNGFAVNNQSDDDILEGDGKGDEVYLRAEVWKLNAGGGDTIKQTVKTIVFGDVNNQSGRGQAGSASAKGGLRTGDAFPPATAQPWRRGAAFFRDRAPMLVWEGVLRQGLDGVAIIPTVWEWDGNNQSESETHWNNLQDLDMTFIEQPLITLIRSRSATTSFDAAASIPRYDYRDGQFGAPGVNLGGKAGTRPIGIKEQHGNIYLLPQILPLSYDSALAAAAASPSGLGAGIFAFRYKDATDHGDYTVYVQVEKVN